MLAVKLYNARGLHDVTEKMAVHMDTQLFATPPPGEYVLQSTPDLAELHRDMTGMALNQNKSVAILFGTSQRLKSLSPWARAQIFTNWYHRGGQRFMVFF